MNSINSLCFSPSFSPSVTHVLRFPISFPLTSTLRPCLSCLSLYPRASVEDKLLAAVGPGHAERQRESRAVWWQITATRVCDGLNCASFTWSPASFLFLSHSCLSLLLASLLYPSPLALPNWNSFFHHSIFCLSCFSIIAFFKPDRTESKEMEAEIDEEG